MFMILEVDDSFSFEKKADADRRNPKVQEWEDLMWKFQKALPDAEPGQGRLVYCASGTRRVFSQSS